MLVKNLSADMVDTADSDPVGGAAEDTVDTEILHLDVKYHMTLDESVSRWRFLTVFQNLECDPNILHFFCNSISPICIAIFLINRISFLNCLWKL
jgi:hypothetical protein